MPPKKRTAPKPVPAVEASAELDSATVAEPIDPAEAAVDEAVPDDGKLTVKFRDVDFYLDREIFTSARFLLSMRKFRYQDILFEVLGPDENTEKFMSTLNFKEPVAAVANEFLDALNAAAGWGNSSTS